MGQENPSIKPFLKSHKVEVCNFLYICYIIDIHEEIQIFLAFPKYAKQRLVRRLFSYSSSQISLMRTKNVQHHGIPVHSVHTPTEMLFALLKQE